MSDSNTRKATVYRFYDSEGNLLYVGVTQYAVNRWKQHVIKSKWAKLVWSVKYEVFDSLKEAQLAETEAIALEKPKYNDRHNHSEATRKKRKEHERHNWWKPIKWDWT